MARVTDTTKARIRFFPFVVLAICLLAATIGQSLRTNDFTPQVTCGYMLAELDAPPPDVLFIGASRVGRGIDAGYIQSRLASEYGKDLRVERVSFNRPYINPYRPVVSRMIEHRGAPRLVMLQLLYNFKADRQPTIDTPINPPGNVVYASIAELADIQFNARLNPGRSILPRQFEAEYQSFVEVLLAKMENNIFSALRYPFKMVRGKEFRCDGRDLHTQAHDLLLYNDISDDLRFEPLTSPEDLARRKKDEATVAEFLPMDLLSDARRFERQQLQDLVAQLQQAGSKVILILLPALHEREIDAKALAEIEQSFPGVPFVHPFSVYQGELGDQLATSFADSHHLDHFGALHLSRFYTDVIAREVE